jgi:hypothetical protein
MMAVALAGIEIDLISCYPGVVNFVILPDVSPKVVVS